MEHRLLKGRDVALMQANLLQKLNRWSKIQCSIIRLKFKSLNTLTSCPASQPNETAASTPTGHYLVPTAKNTTGYYEKSNTNKIVFDGTL